MEKLFLSLLADGQFEQDDSLRQLWNPTSHHASMATVAGAAPSYTDVGLLLTPVSPLVLRQVVGFGNMEPKRPIAIANPYTLAFFDVYLKEKPLEPSCASRNSTPRSAFATNTMMVCRHATGNILIKSGAL